MASTDPENQPYALLLELLEGHFSAEVYDQRQIDSLRKFYALQVHEQPGWARQFKEELREVLRENPASLEPDAIFEITDHSHQTDRDFLEIIWEDLFPGEPVPAVND